MKTIKSLIGGVALVASAGAFATPVTLGGESPDLQAVINQLYTNAGTSTTLAPDVNVNQAGESGQFKVEASGGSVSTMVIEVSAHSTTNSFGIYDVIDPTKVLELFSGSDAEGGQKFLSVTNTFLFSVAGGGSKQFNGSTFGYYLRDGTGPTTFYSQVGLNGGNDQMVAFQGDGDLIQLPTRPAGNWGPSSYILAWEDLPLPGSDKDYQDFVVYVESITPVPEPGTIALLGLAGLGMSLVRRRKSVKSETA
jgi:hypothetical protein